MFKTIKSKIIVSTIVILAFLMLAFGFHTIFSRMNAKQLMVQNYRAFMTAYFDEISDSVARLEDNLKSLTLIGGLFYKTDRSYELTDRAITKIFESYPETLGGGIWFIPYKLDKNKKYVCFYAYRDKNNKVVIDRNFASKKYDYPNQGWYKQIISEITPEHNFVWSKPYFENQGSYAMMVTMGSGIYVDNELVGIATVDWEIDSVFEKISKMKPEDRAFSMYQKGKKIENSFALFGNKKQDYILATNDPYLEEEKLVGRSLKAIPWYAENLFYITYIKYHGKKYVPFEFKDKNSGITLVICVPKSEMFRSVDEFYIMMIIIVLLFVIVTLALVYYGLNIYLIKPIVKLTNIANKISKGEDVHIKVEKPEEFAQLASTFDKMTSNIKSITKEKEKINSELSIARAIQLSSLPSVFPAFPDNANFDIYASMTPAKEVGGDFYDFYFIDDKHLMFLIADVSGKGVPAALFMMTVKTLINNIAQINCPPKELIKDINDRICKNNSEGFFVTMLSAIVDIKTGKIIFVNCGHNPPMIKKNKGEYEYLKMDSNIPLGVFGDFDFELYETQLEAGDIIFAYTDGITEATNTEGELFGEERLEKYMSEIKEESSVYGILNQVRSKISDFVGSAEQSDDITMLAFKYQNSEKRFLKQYKSLASVSNYKSFYTWLHEVCKDFGVEPELMNKLDMCAEEIYANISFYAYNGEAGEINVIMKKDEKNITMVFKDNGKKYNPLEKPDPDITLPPEERPLGGLGIFMVKEMADDILYERVNNRNVLALYFNNLK